MKKIIIPLLVIALAITLSGCSLFGGSSTTKQVADGGILRSTDFGEIWQQKSPAITQADMRLIAFDTKDENVAYAAMSSGGIYKTVDGGESWQGTTAPGGVYAGITIDPLNTNVIYGINNNKIIKTVDAMATWFDTYVEPRPDQKLLTVLSDPYRSNVLYAATTTSVIKSTDYGNTWKLTNFQSTTTILSLQQSSKNTNILYVLTGKNIYKSTNGGIDWTDSSAGLTSFSGATTLYWLDFDPQTEYMLLGTKDSILKSIDGAVNWQEVPTLFEFKKVPIKAAIHSPEDINSIIFTYNNILIKTDNGGKTWKSLKSVPTTRPITYLAINPFHHDTIYAGTTVPPPAKKKSNF